MLSGRVRQQILLHYNSMLPLLVPSDKTLTYDGSEDYGLP